MKWIGVSFSKDKRRREEKGALEEVGMSCMKESNCYYSHNTEIN